MISPITTAVAPRFDFSASKRIRALEEKAVRDIAKAATTVGRQIEKFGSGSKEVEKAVENRDRTQVKAVAQLSKVESALLSSPIVVNQASTAVDSYPAGSLSTVQRPVNTEAVGLQTGHTPLKTDVILTSHSEVGPQTVAATPVPLLTAGNAETPRPTPSTPFSTPTATTPASNIALLESGELDSGASSAGSTPTGQRALEQSSPSTAVSVADPAPKPSILTGFDRATPSGSGTSLSANAPVIVGTFRSQSTGTASTSHANSSPSFLGSQGTVPQKIAADSYPSLRNLSLEEGTVRFPEHQLDNASPKNFGYAYGRAQRVDPILTLFSSPTTKTSPLSTARNYGFPPLGTNRTTSTPPHLPSGGIALSILSSLTASISSRAQERNARTLPGIAEYDRSQGFVERARPNLFQIRL